MAVFSVTRHYFSGMPPLKQHDALNMLPELKKNPEHSTGE
jgi:hypothetical protein